MTQIVRIKDVDKKLSIKMKNGEYSNNNKNRTSLTVYWKSKSNKTAVAIGINPSKANDTRSDKTLTTLARFLDAYGYCEIKMLNIFESYSTDQRGIDRVTTTDFYSYEDIFNEVDSIFIVWGVDDSYLDEKNCILNLLKKYDYKVFCVQNARGNFPIHPSRMSYDNDIINYNFK